MKNVAAMLGLVHVVACTLESGLCQHSCSSLYAWVLPKWNIFRDVKNGKCISSSLKC